MDRYLVIGPKFDLIKQSNAGPFMVDFQPVD